MTKPNSWSSREQSLLLLNAYLDNELDAASVLDVEQRLASDPALRVEHERLVQLRRRLASHRAGERASDDLRRRIAAIADTPLAADPAPDKVVPLPKRPARTYGWQHMAAAAALAAVVAGVSTFSLVQEDPGSGDIAAIVTDHRRALLAATPYDVASSDRHTVKPWFDSKLALSPQVFDLSSAGFPLAGGRVEILDGKPVPVLVYQRRAHVISVVAAPRSGLQKTSEPSRVSTHDGYSVIEWHGRDFDYFVVSDLAEPELEEFVTLWRKEAGDR
jgi:anti-sigma factor RsiW